MTKQGYYCYTLQEGNTTKMLLTTIATYLQQQKHLFSYVTTTMYVPDILCNEILTYNMNKLVTIVY